MMICYFECVVDIVVRVILGPQNSPGQNDSVATVRVTF